MDLREQIARAICGNWVVGDDRPWQAWLEEADAVLEVLAKQEPVAFGLYSGWALKATYLKEYEACDQRDRRQLTADLGGSLEAYRVAPLYPAPGAQPDLNLSCKSVQARLATQWGYVRKDDAQAEQIRNEIQRLRAALTDTLDFVERHSNRWDGVNGKHPMTVVTAARNLLPPIPAAPKPEER